MNLVEKVLTIDISKNKDNKSQYFFERLDDVWEMIQKSYSYVGGYKGSPNMVSLLKETKIWKIVRRGSRITAVVAYKDRWGLKNVCAAYDGTFRGKKDIYMLFCEDIRMQRSWAEVSSKVEKIELKLGSIPISNQFAEDILNKPILKLYSDGYHYDRVIGGEVETKMLVGWVKGYNFLSKILK